MFLCKYYAHANYLILGFLYKHDRLNEGVRSLKCHRIESVYDSTSTD